jgi:AraC-like DNA-binding protein
MFAKNAIPTFSSSFEEKLHLPQGREGFVVVGGQGQHPMHRHKEIEFNLVLSGTARYILVASDGTTSRVDLATDSLIWLLPTQDHVLVEKSEDYRHWIVVATPPLLARLPLTFPKGTGVMCRVLESKKSMALALFCEEIALLSPAESLSFNAGLGYLMARAWEIFSHAPGTSRQLVHPAVAHAIRLLKTQPELESGVSEIAKACGISAPVLARHFQAQTGMSLLEFRQRERVRLAIELLGTPNPPTLPPTLLDIALQSGFGSYASFYRAFCEVTGTKPSDWQK